LPPVQNLAVLPCEIVQNVAIALPVLDVKAVPDFYDNFVNC